MALFDFVDVAGPYFEQIEEKVKGSFGITVGPALSSFLTGTTGHVLGEYINFVFDPESLLDMVPGVGHFLHSNPTLKALLLGIGGQLSFTIGENTAVVYAGVDTTCKRILGKSIEASTPYPSLSEFSFTIKPPSLSLSGGNAAAIRKGLDDATLTMTAILSTLLILCTLGAELYAYVQYKSSFSENPPNEQPRMVGVLKSFSLLLGNRLMALCVELEKVCQHAKDAVTKFETAEKLGKTALVFYSKDLISYPTLLARLQEAADDTQEATQELAACVATMRNAIIGLVGLAAVAAGILTAGLTAPESSNHEDSQTESKDNQAKNNNGRKDDLAESKTDHQDDAVAKE